MVTLRTSLVTRFVVGAIAVVLFALPTVAAQPITTDSRIKTLVYNANEVFNITTHYGYQSNIEFGPKEVIDTISVGDRVGWQITPAGRRLFIRAQEENAHTNMTVVTNLRAYQFDLRSSSADAVFGSEELTYVVRFYYPDEQTGSILPEMYTNNAVMPPITAMPPVAAAPVPSVTIPNTVTANALYNYRYTYSGSGPLAPTKIFDDGKTTYFKFTSAMDPSISIITAKGESLNVPTRRTSDGLIAVDAIAPRFSLRQANQQVVVYNEAGGAM